MLLLESHLPINLEALDAKGNTISGMAAVLCHLDGEWAVIALQPDSPTPCLHWGARVRFWVGTGPRGYEVIGAVAGLDLNPSFSSDSNPDGSEETAQRFAGEVRVRLFECHPRSQRRSAPRRRARFAVRATPIAASAPESQAETPEQGMTGACIDISCSGMRLRVERLRVAPERMALEFTLPAHRDAIGGKQPSHTMRLTGCVLRQEPSARRADSLVVAVKFESLSVEDGLALSSFVY